MWNDEFPGFWYIWGQEPSHKKGAKNLPGNIKVVFGDTKTSWAEGIHEMLIRAREFVDCEYFFTHGLKDHE